MLTFPKKDPGQCCRDQTRVRSVLLDNDSNGTHSLLFVFAQFAGIEGDPVGLNTVLYLTAETLRACALVLHPVVCRS